MEDCAGQLQFAAELGGVTEVPVVRQRHFPLLMIDLNRLAVSAAGTAGRAVAHMADGHIPLRQTRKRIGRKDFADQPDVLMRGKNTIVVDDNAAALLPTVLQGIQAVIYGVSDIRFMRAHYPEHAAFFVQIHSIHRPFAKVSAAPMKPVKRGCGRFGRLLNSGWNCTPT